MNKTGGQWKKDKERGSEECHCPQNNTHSFLQYVIENGIIIAHGKLTLTQPISLLTNMKNIPGARQGNKVLINNTRDDSKVYACRICLMW